MNRRFEMTQKSDVEAPQHVRSGRCLLEP